MNIPNFENVQFVDRNGYLTEKWALIMQQLITALQTNLSNEGYIVPSQTAANITQIQTNVAASSNPAAYNGDLLYDSTNNKLKVNLNGAFKEIVTLP
jgi:hypothetical protein